MADTTSPFSVFISYAHRDDNEQDVSKRYLHRMRRQLASLTRQGRVEVFTDKEIKTGEVWREKLLNALRNAKAAILLVGPEFFDSDFVRDVEVPLLLDKVDREGLTILSLILGPCRFQETLFKYPDAACGPNEKSLSVFQTANPPTNPFTRMTEHEQEEIFVSVARSVQEIVDSSPTIKIDAVPGEADEHVRAVEGALHLLSDLVRDSQTLRSAVRRFRFTFEAASSNIEKLSAYKALHDELHTLQLRCLDLISVELPVFQDDPASEDRLIGPEQDLKKSISAIKAGEKRWEKFDFRVNLLLDDLQAADEELQAALSDHNPTKLRRCRFLLDRVLNTYPAKINTLLVETARRLQLPMLVETMSEVKSRLEATGVVSNEVQQFVEGVSSLSALDVRLQDLLYEHDGWQTADSEMRMMEINGDDFLEELNLSWPRLKVITEILYRQNPAELAQQLEEDSQRLEAAFVSENSTIVKRAYRSFRRRAGLRFYEVDTDLLDLCSRLQEIGVPLDGVLERLDPDAS